MDDFFDEDEEDVEDDRLTYEEKIAILKAIEIDRSMIKNLTKEDMEGYDCPFYELEELDGNYIEEFERKTREDSIEVSETYLKYIEEYKVPLHGFDLRTGVYGLKYAAAGFYSAGCMYMEQDKLDEAIANFAKAIELEPRLIPARGYKAQCYFLKGDFLRSSAEAWNAVDLNPVLIAERDEKSRAVVSLIHPDSKAKFEELLVMHLVVRGMAFLYEKSYDDALLDFEDIIKRNPNVTNAYYGRAVVYVKFSDYWKFDEWDKIILNCDKLIEAQYEELFAHQFRGIAYSKLDKIDEAIADFDAVLSIDTNQPSIYLHRSYCHCHKKDYQKALADADEAIRLGSTEAYLFRGITYIELGEYEKAIADFDEAIRLDPEDERIPYQRGKAVKLMNGESFEEEKEKEKD